MHSVIVSLFSQTLLVNYQHLSFSLLQQRAFHCLHQSLARGRQITLPEMLIFLLICYLRCCRHSYLHRLFHSFSAIILRSWKTGKEPLERPRLRFGHRRIKITIVCSLFPAVTIIVSNQRHPDKDDCAFVPISAYPGYLQIRSHSTVFAICKCQANFKTICKFLTTFKIIQSLYIQQR